MEKMVTELGDVKRTIEVSPKIKWVRAILRGNFNCPDCGKAMVVIASPSGYGFCLECKKCWIQEVRMSRRDLGVDIDYLDRCIRDMNWHPRDCPTCKHTVMMLDIDILPVGDYWEVVSDGVGAYQCLTCGGIFKGATILLLTPVKIRG